MLVSKNKHISPWVITANGDSTLYLDEHKKTVSNAVVVVRSLQWPGAFNFYYQGRYLSVYVGNGLKYEEAKYFPVNPPKVASDPEEYEEQPEPNPTDAELAILKQKEEEAAKLAAEGEA